MRQWTIVGAVVVATLGGGGWAQAQHDPLGFYNGVYTARGQAPANPGFDAGLNSEPTIPIPTGQSGDAGFYGAVEYVMLTQNRTIGDQVVAYRGIFDATGAQGGPSGAFIGSASPALTTNQLGRTTYSPGFRVELGYRFDDGSRIYANYLQLFDAHYSAGASLVPYNFVGGINQAETFLTSPVYNFGPQYSGPSTKITQDIDGVGTKIIMVPVVTGAGAPVVQVGGGGITIITTTPTFTLFPLRVATNAVVVTGPTAVRLGVNQNSPQSFVQIQTIIPPGIAGQQGQVVTTTVPQFTTADAVTGSLNPGLNAYGIWNAASVMDIKFTQRYQEAEVGTRVPVYQTDYSRVYAIAGGKFGWFFERFNWRTVSYDVNGIARSVDQAFYTNTLSQRLYGPMVGAGHEIFVSNQFSLSCDLTGAMLLGIIKQRATYELGDKSNRAKRSNNQFAIVPNANANLNLWWYPVEGVQVRVGYNALTYFNTQRMEEPIGFNFGAIDPKYDTQWFRYLHGVNVGVGLFF